jgi:hypothetical protein
LAKADTRAARVIVSAIKESNRLHVLSRVGVALQNPDGRGITLEKLRELAAKGRELRQKQTEEKA